MFGNYLIGLREGLEASLVVCILIAYLVKTGNQRRLLPAWLGVGLAVALSLAFGALLQFGSSTLTFQAQELLGGTLSVLSVGLVTWMVFWMRRTARHLTRELQGRLDAALALGTGALIATSFLAVGREGLETSLFIWTAVQAGGDGARPLAGALLGLASAVLLGRLFYRGTLRIDLAAFFRWTGAMLVLVAAGVLAYGIHDLQEGDLLPGLRDLAFDISDAVPPDSWYGTLLKGVFNFQPDPTVLQVVVWLLYLVPVMALFLAPQGPRRSLRARRPASRPTGEQRGDPTGDRPRLITVCGREMMYENHRPDARSSQDAAAQAEHALAWLAARDEVERTLGAPLERLPSERDERLARMAEVLQATARGLGVPAAAVWAGVPEELLRRWLAGDEAFASAVRSAAALAAVHGHGPERAGTPAAIRVVVLALSRGVPWETIAELVGLSTYKLRQLRRASPALVALVDAARRQRARDPRKLFLSSYRSRPSKGPGTAGFRLVQRDDS